jgi:hypothetical protein
VLLLPLLSDFWLLALAATTRMLIFAVRFYTMWFDFWIRATSHTLRLSGTHVTGCYCWLPCDRSRDSCDAIIAIEHLDVRRRLVDHLRNSLRRQRHRLPYADNGGVNIKLQGQQRQRNDYIQVQYVTGNNQSNEQRHRPVRTWLYKRYCWILVT